MMGETNTVRKAHDATAPPRAPVYVISRDGEPERLVALWAEADRLGIELHRVAATDGVAGEDSARMRLSDHRRAWQRVAEGEHSHAVVLEDVAALDDRLAPFLDAARLVRDLPPRAVVNLDGGRPGDGEPRIAAAPNGFGRCSAYVLASEAASTLLAAPRGDETLERALAGGGEHGLTLCVVEPALVVMPETGVSETGWRARLAGLSRRLLARSTGRAEAEPVAAVPPLRPLPQRPATTRPATETA